MSEFGLSVSALYSFITDLELDELVSQIKCEFPNCGYRLLHGHLMSRSQRVSQARIRESLERNPQGVAVRWSSAIQRREYAVLAPLSLWHLDGNNKLIRYIHPSIHTYIHAYIPTIFCLQGPVRPRLDTAITILQSNTAM